MNVGSVWETRTAEATQDYFPSLLVYQRRSEMSESRSEEGERV